MTSATRTLMREALSWAFLAILTAIAISHFQELKVLAVQFMDVANAPTTHADNGKRSRSRTTSTAVADEHAFGTTRIRRSRGGHYRTRASINNQQIDVMVDTGATLVAMSYEDARSAGIFVSPSDFTARSRTANGIAHFARVTISKLSIGNITLRNVKAAVARPGAMGGTLLGMSFLGRLSRVEMRDGELVLQK